MDDQENGHEALEQLLIDASAEPIMLSYVVLKDITKDFSNVIGYGGFGEVYKGVLQNGEVAVKKLYNTNVFSDKQFQDELKCLKRVKHKNTVRFLGYCSDKLEKPVWHDGRYVVAEERLRYLCFGYAPNGSLDNYLKDESHRREWDTHYQLIEGICQGLRYLHEEERIAHLDLKPANVLLDADMVPKITDFGISRRFSGAQSTIITKNLRGSLGYIAPELLNRGEISFKSDIFSLGVIIRNLLRGSNDLSDLENWIQALDTDCPQVKRSIKIAELCVDGDPGKRPTIDRIIDMLSGKETVIQMVSPVYGHSKNNLLSPPDQLNYDPMQFLGIDRGMVRSASEQVSLQQLQDLDFLISCFWEDISDGDQSEFTGVVHQQPDSSVDAQIQWTDTPSPTNNSPVMMEVDDFAQASPSSSSTGAPLITLLPIDESTYIEYFHFL